MDDDLEAAVSRWAADQGAEEVARIRGAARRLAEEAAEDRDLAGVLRELAGTGRPLRVVTTGGRVHRATLEVVGRDFLALATERSWGLVALGGVAAVRVDPQDHDPSQAWSEGPDWSEFPPELLAHAIERLAGQDLPVRVHSLDDSAGLVGELAAAGTDFLQLSGDPLGPAGGAGTVYVPLGSVAELWLLLRSG